MRQIKLIEESEFEDLLLIYAKSININASMVLSKRRTMDICLIRELFWYYLLNIGYSKRMIACSVAKNRQTVISGIRRIENLIETNDIIIEPYLGFIKEYCHQQQDS